MSLGGFGRDFKKQPRKPSVEKPKDYNSQEIFDTLKRSFGELEEHNNQFSEDLKELKERVGVTSREATADIMTCVEESLGLSALPLENLKEKINRLQDNQALLSLGAHRALTEVTSLLDSKFEELKETQVEVDYTTINKQFKKMETILIQHKSSIQLLTNELEKKNPWIPVLIGCLIGLSGVLGYVGSLI